VKVKKKEKKLKNNQIKGKKRKVDVNRKMDKRK